MNKRGKRRRNRRPRTRGSGKFSLDSRRETVEDRPRVEEESLGLAGVASSASDSSFESLSAGTSFDAKSIVTVLRFMSG